MKKIYSLLKLLRPHQWVKNGFVFIGLFFGQAWNNSELVIKAILIFIAFCLASSCVYVFNDMVDRERDRFHPKKRNRGIASGEISLTQAAILLIVVGISGFVIALHVGIPVGDILAIYVILNLAYSLYLKNVVILDVFIIAAGFMLRILAGTLGLGIPPSQWLLVCGLMFTLFLGFSKRRAELFLDDGVNHRQVLDDYSPSLLDHMMAVTGAAVIVSYALYTVSDDTIVLHKTRHLIVTIPFVLYGLFRYMFKVYRGRGGDDISLELVSDPHILVAFISWFLVTLYLIA